MVKCKLTWNIYGEVSSEMESFVMKCQVAWNHT